MNKLIVILAGSSVLLAAPAFARHEDNWDYARVVRAEPIYRQVRISEPHQVCHEEPVTERTVYRGYSDPGAVLIGGIIGGVIGHQFGGGHGKDAATAAGAVIGASHAARHHSYPGRVVERTVYETSCRTVRQARYEERIEGYDVTYRYHGRLYHTRMPYDPGKRVRVRLDAEPLNDDGYGDD